MKLCKARTIGVTKIVKTQRLTMLDLPIEELRDVDPRDSMKAESEV